MLLIALSLLWITSSQPSLVIEITKLGAHSLRQSISIIYNAHNVEIISNLRRGQSPGGYSYTAADVSFSVFLK